MVQEEEVKGCMCVCVCKKLEKGVGIDMLKSVMRMKVYITKRW